MQHQSALLEIMRWGYAHFPGAIFCYAKELDLDLEDIGVLTAIFYAFENTKPLFQSGVRTGQILHSCPTLTTNKLSRKLQKLSQMDIVALEGSGKNFTEKIVRIEPLMNKLEQLVLRDHPQMLPMNEKNIGDGDVAAQQLQKYQTRVEELEQELEEKLSFAFEPINLSDLNYKKVADFISQKTGNLLSMKMENELRKWLTENGLTAEFLLCILELSFERNITNPRDITKIVRDLKEYSVNNLDGLYTYFNNYVDLEKNHSVRSNQFDPDIGEFGSFTGVDMTAEARKMVYNKWKYQWGFTHPMIMKAGELMCQRTKNGGLEYIDSVLNNWMTKEIRSLADVDKEIAAFKSRSKTNKKPNPGNVNTPAKRSITEYEFYVPPEVIAELKSKV